MELKDIKALIEQYQSIIICRHIHADFDAFGSQCGLKQLIIDNYPDKKVYLYGTEECSAKIFDRMDRISNEILENSLAIILDTSTVERIDDKGILNAKYVIKMDHHLKSEKFANDEYVDESSCSASAIVVQLALDSNWLISKEAASFLYCGISSDTLKLTIDKVNGEVFRLVAVLADKGIDIPLLNRYVYDIPITTFKSQNYFLSRAQFVNDVGYFYITNSDINKLGIMEKDTRDFIDALGHIKGVDKYVVFTQKDNELYSVSLRSHLVPIVHIAQKYGGGGHALACGIPEVSYDVTKKIINELINTKE